MVAAAGAGLRALGASLQPPNISRGMSWKYPATFSVVYGVVWRPSLNLPQLEEHVLLQEQVSLTVASGYDLLVGSPWMGCFCAQQNEVPTSRISQDRASLILAFLWKVMGRPGWQYFACVYPKRFKAGIAVQKTDLACFENADPNIVTDFHMPFVLANRAEVFHLGGATVPPWHFARKLGHGVWRVGKMLARPTGS